MTYAETLEYLYTRLPMYQRVGKTAYKQDLSNTIRLMEYLNDPHTKFKSIHIAGTNGKGTSAHAIAATFQSAGYKTGLYTSPHLVSFTERIRINGTEIPQKHVMDFVERIKPAVEEIEPSFFEITVAMAFDYFSNETVDIAVIETGLGGRLDSTNVITPEVCLITNIGYDHTDLLGETLLEIAREKAGIIKKETPIVIGTTQPEVEQVFEEFAEKNHAPLILAKEHPWQPEKLVPSYLIKNYPGIKSVVEELVQQGWKVNANDLENGMDNMNELTGLKGRFQVLNEKPLIIADVSHNPDGLSILFEQVKAICKGKIHLIFGTVKDKKLEPVFNQFPSNTNIYWTQSQVPRALPVEELAIQGIMCKLQGECFKNVNEAIRQAKQKVQPDDIVLITGSTFVVAEIDGL